MAATSTVNTGVGESGDEDVAISTASTASPASTDEGGVEESKSDPGAPGKPSGSNKRAAPPSSDAAEVATDVKADAPVDVADDGGEDVVEKVPMPPPLVAWVQEWTDLHFVQEPFVKRKRKRYLEDKVEDGKGDPRITQVSDVYRAPSSARKARES